MERITASLGRTAFPALLAAGLAAIAGCSPPPHAASTLSRLESEPRLDLQLSADEQDELVAAMKSVAEGHQPSSRAEVYVREMRWSDIPAAVSVACDQPGVEMVIVRQEEFDDGIVFHLRTVEDRPAWIRFTRINGDKLYGTETRIGRFNFEHDRERMERLCEEVDRAMQEYAQKKRLPAR